MAVRIPSLGFRQAPKVKVVKPVKQNLALKAASLVPSSMLLPSSSLGAGYNKPMKVKPINVRNKGFGY